MEGVISIINLKNKVPIIVYAKNAIYNKINNNTYFITILISTILTKLYLQKT